MENIFSSQFFVSDIVLACYVAPGCGESVHKNRKSHGIAINISGKKLYVFEDKKSILIQQNEIIYLPKGSNYIVKDIEKGGCYAINFNINTDERFEPFSFKAKNAGEYIRRFSQAENAWSLKKEGFSEKCLSELYAIIYQLKHERSESYISSGMAQRIRPALNYIAENYAKENISVSYLAKMCSISEVYMRKIFRSIFSASPVKYINSLRLARAKELLESGMYSVGEASNLSGFSDESYFCREFKKYFGASPASFK